MSPNHNPEVRAVVAGEAQEAYETLRGLSQRGYSMPPSVRRLPVWSALAEVLVRDDIPDEDWMKGQFDYSNGGSPFVTALASAAARKNYERWRGSVPVASSPQCVRIDDDLRRARSIAGNVGLKVLDAFFLDTLSGFMAITRCALCSDLIFRSVTDRFGETCREEIERNPSLLRHLTYEPRLHALQGLGIVPVVTT